MTFECTGPLTRDERSSPSAFLSSSSVLLVSSKVDEGALPLSKTSCHLRWVATPLRVTSPAALSPLRSTSMTSMPPSSDTSSIMSGSMISRATARPEKPTSSIVTVLRSGRVSFAFTSPYPPTIAGSIPNREIKPKGSSSSNARTVFVAPVTFIEISPGPPFTCRAVAAKCPAFS